jgi:hypothetical protein
LVLSLHAMGLAVVVGFSSAIALRLLGVARSIPLAPLGGLFPVMYAGFWVNALSGLPAKAVAVVSLVAWFGVIYFGRMIMYNDTLLYALGM